jgi:hypothetical protein
MIHLTVTKVLSPLRIEARFTTVSEAAEFTRLLLFNSQLCQQYREPTRMPRKKKTQSGKKILDKGLQGTWFQCDDGHLTSDPITMGSRSYCRNENCDKEVFLVHTVFDDVKDNKWNDIDPAFKRRLESGTGEHAPAAPVDTSGRDAFRSAAIKQEESAPDDGGSALS